MKAPCKNCPDRKVTEYSNCHSTCEKYIAFKIEIELARENKNKRMALESDIVEIKKRRYR